MSQREDWYGSALLTDLYQLTMLQSYYAGGMTDQAVFEFFIRRLPASRNFLVAAGLADLVEYLLGLRFTARDLAALQATELFDDPFLARLETFAFTGDVDALPEGTVCFAEEPLVRITAPLPEAQLVESRLINLLHFETMIASKAARFALAADGRQLVDFGMRRSHGAEAAVLAARANYLAGFAGTATVAAHPLYGIPVFGTMAHSFIEAHDTEGEAFLRFSRGHRGPLVLLIDTYDTETGARRVAEAAETLAAEGIEIAAVRIDSGDLEQLARRVREVLDAAGRERIGIFVSGGLDESAVERMLAGGAPIDGFGIGTALDASVDAPYLDCAYKLQLYAGRPRRKLSPGKTTWPGAKQVYRHRDRHGRLDYDVVTLADDAQRGEPLLEPVMRGGALLAPLPDLEAARKRAAENLASLPDRLRALHAGGEYRVEMAPALQALAARTATGRP